MDIRAIDFFSGLGGWRYALKGMGTIVSAYDVSEVANSAYRLNFGEQPNTRELASVSIDEIITLNANAWLMSPPCQPFCRMGRGKGLMDARCAAFIHLMDLLLDARPQRLVLENVTGFFETDAFVTLTERLTRIGLAWRCFNLCPTHFGIPNRRPRVFVAASANGVLNASPPSIEPCPIFNYLDPIEDEGLYLSRDIIARHGPGLDIVTVESRRSACFIGGYGKRLVGAGSFLQTERGIRRFSPMEISRLLGYPQDFRFPQDMPINNRYKLLGNGLNIVAAEWALAQLL